jgi:hypothetical protein
MNKMENSEIKKMILNSLGSTDDNRKIASELQDVLDYDFREGFEQRIIDRISARARVVQYEFDKMLSLAFYRVTVTAAAAIVLLMISIFLSQGTLSFNSLLGLGDNYSESIVCLLTGN